MYPEAYKEWIGIFNDDLLRTWQSERRELQKTAMLFTALQAELKDVQTNLEIEIINLQQQLKYKDELNKTQKSLSPRSKRKSPQSINKENILEALIDSENTISCTQKESPDLFKNINPNIPQEPHNTPVIDLSVSDEDSIVGGSPTIKRRKRHYPRSKVNSPSCNSSNTATKPKKAENTPLNKVAQSLKINLFKTPVLKSDDDLSIIENTPEVSCQRTGTLSKVSGFSSMASWKSKRSGNTLTQMFGKARKKLEVNPSKNLEDDADSDETYFEEERGEPDGSKMGITDLLSYINKEESVISEKRPITPSELRGDCESTDCDLEVDSSQEVDQFSKGGIFDEADVATPTDESKVIPIEPEPVVRGKARKQLHGWACEKCRNFYGKMNLSPEELQKKMDECSRHRYKYQPPEETLPGFWDLSIPPDKPD